jgi:putative membrane protein
MKMALFIDNLTTMLYVLTAADVYIAYVLAKGRGMGRESSGPLLGLGFIALILGASVDLRWPLPGGYNIVYGDPYVLFAALLISAGVMSLVQSSLKGIEGLGVPMGIFVIIYGLSILENGLSTEPLVAASLFVLEGLSAIIASIALARGGRAPSYAAIALLGLSAIVALAIVVPATFVHPVAFSKWFP